MLDSWTKERKEALLDPMEKVLKQGTKATKKTYHIYKGRIVSQSEDTDHMARLRAAELIAQVTGIKQSPDKPTVNIQVNVVTPDWAKGEESITVRQIPDEGGGG